MLHARAAARSAICSAICRITPGEGGLAGGLRLDNSAGMLRMARCISPLCDYSGSAIFVVGLRSVPILLEFVVIWVC